MAFSIFPKLIPSLLDTSLKFDALVPSPKQFEQTLNTASAEPSTLFSVQVVSKFPKT